LEQDKLYAVGRTVPGEICTNVKGSTYSSCHQWGIAFDIYLVMDVDGDGQIKDDSFNNKTGLFNKIGQIGKKYGLLWGGDFNSFFDGPHFQLEEYSPTGGTSYLKNKYGTPEKFKKTWYPVKPKLMVTPESGEQYILWLQSQLNKAFKALKAPIVVKVDGIYGNQVKAAVKELYRFLGWNKNGKADGSKIGIKTINILSEY
jgi:hypothetical protein